MFSTTPAAGFSRPVATAATAAPQPVCVVLRAGRRCSNGLHVARVAAASPAGLPLPDRAACKPSTSYGLLLGHHAKPGRWSRPQLPPPQAVQEEVDSAQADDGRIVVDIDGLNEEWGIPSALQFGVGMGGLPVALLQHPQTGMQLAIYLHGACVAQWLKPDGTVTFYDGPDEGYDGELPLRTGLSVHFPQHREGQLPEHGFADRMLWEVAGAGFENPQALEMMDEFARSHGVDEDEDEDEAGEGGLQPEASAADGEADGEGALDEDDDEDEVVEGVMPDVTVDTDLSPYIILRLADNDETRKMWPHKFELLYKITLQVQDDYTEADIEEMLASQSLTGRGVDEDDEDEGMGEGYVPLDDEGEGEVVASTRGVEDGDVDVEVEALDERTEDVAPETGDSGDSPAPSGRKAKRGADADGAANFEPHTVTNVEPMGPSVQVKLEFWVTNNDDAGSAPMEFNLGALARIVTMDQATCGDWVKVLGLGGCQTFDYTQDPRYPSLDMNMDDFLHFRGQPVDTTYIDAAGATVYLCPGNRSHFEFVLREGFKDIFVSHPGAEADPAYTRATGMGMGYVAAPKRLQPGDTWHGEGVLRFHNRYWKPPIFGDDSMPPMPPIPAAMLADAVDDADDEFEESPGAL